MARLPVLFVVFLAFATALPAAAQDLSLRTFGAMLWPYLAASREARARGEIGDDAKRAKVYLEQYLASHPAAARCLPDKDAAYVAGLLLFASQLKATSARGDATPALDAALVSGPACRFDEDALIQALLLLRSPSAAMNLTSRLVAAEVVAKAGARDERRAACLAQARDALAFADAAAAHLAASGGTPEIGEPNPAVGEPGSVARNALARVCDPPPPAQKIFIDREGHDTQLANKGCKRSGTFSPTARAQPVFPRAAIRFDILRAAVVTHVYIGAAGTPVATSIVSVKPPWLYGVFDQAIADAMRKWRFEPGCPFIAEFELNFQLTD